MTTENYKQVGTMMPGIPTEVSAEQLRGELAQSLGDAYRKVFGE